MTRFGQRITVMGLLALAVGAGAESAQAQAGLLGPGAAYLGGGISKIATGELDDRLAARGYPTFGQTAVALGIGGYRVLSSGVMLGFEGQGLIVGEEDHDGRDVGVGGGYATLGIGYAVELSPRARVYPRIGIGGGGLALEIESAGDSVGFDDVLAEPRPAPDDNDPVLSRDGFVVDVGAGVEFLPRRRGGGPLIGLRFGYLAAPFDDNWDLVFQGEAIGGPDATISGPYIRIVIGGAWSR